MGKLLIFPHSYYNHYYYMISQLLELFSFTLILLQASNWFWLTPPNQGIDQEYQEYTEIFYASILMAPRLMTSFQTNWTVWRALHWKILRFPDILHIFLFMSSYVNHRNVRRVFSKTSLLMTLDAEMKMKEEFSSN